ncbi:MAG: phage major capsid protein [Pyrinomonadaceae bacterium]
MKIIETREILQRLQAKPIHRTFAIERAAVSQEARTASLAFASNKPIEHWFGKLSLTLDKKAMRADRLQAGAPLLVEHNTSDQVGVVESHTIGADGVARAVVRFGESVRAQEVFRDVQTGIRQNVSVGFMIHSLELVDDGKKSADGIPQYRSDNWTPYEVSLVSVPADISVGVGRSTEKKIMSTNVDNEFVTRTREIVEFAEIFGEADLARNMIAASSAVTVDDVRSAIQSRRKAPALNPPPMDPRDVAFQQGGINRVEYARSIPRYGRLRSFTGPDAEQRAHRFGQWVLAGPMGNRSAQMWCQQNGVMLSRAAQIEGVNEKGGFTVPEEFGNDIVQLMEKYGVFRSHAHIVPMSSDRRTDPILNGELESQFVGEMEEGSDQDLDFGMIGYTARKQMVLIPFSSELSEDSAISIGDHLAEASARAFAYKEDICGFNGDGTSTYGGMLGIREALKSVDGTIANIKGLQVGSGNAYSELALVDFEGVVGRLPDYADTGSASWYVSRKFYYNVMVRLLLAASGTTPTEIEDARNRKFLGYPVVFAKVMPSTEANSQVCAIFGDLSLGARLADRRLFTTAIDESLLFRKDALLFRATSRFDINCSFGVGDTTDAGPIVGLITAAS